MASSPTPTRNHLHQRGTITANGRRINSTVKENSSLRMEHTIRVTSSRVRLRYRAGIFSTTGVTIKERLRMERHRGMEITSIRIRITSIVDVGSGISLTARGLRSSGMGRIIKATSRMESRKVTVTMSVNRVSMRVTSKMATSAAKGPSATPTAAPTKVNGAKECSQATASSRGPMETATKDNTPKA